MSVDLPTILKLIDEILALEKKVETAISSEGDAKRRAKLLKACKDRDLAAIKEILYEVN
jgi:hypothetical protein